MTCNVLLIVITESCIYTYKIFSTVDQNDLAKLSKEKSCRYAK